MNLLLALLIVFAPNLAVGPGFGDPVLAVADSTLRVMTFNIRYNNPGDGEHAWPHRKERVASVIRFHEADLVGMQEALKGQIDDVAALLPDYAWIGVGRDDGVAAGEFSPIFYRKDRFDLVAHATFWLSETPDAAGSQGWDAALPRVVTWGRFRDRATGAAFFLFNTHFDHRGERARTESARLLRAQIDALAGDAPVVVTGDFNAEPTTEAYHVMTTGLYDARRRSLTPPHGPDETFWGFTVETGEEGRRIDYIFVKPGVRVRRYGVLTDHWNGHFPSDHLPVLAEVALP
jgi:endonuclease/exonuclease/phosphatase family metal-dependent hydrolase